MGFFDDLDAQVGDIPDDLGTQDGPGDYSAVLAKLRGGWAPKLRRNEPGKKSMREAMTVQEVELGWDGTRFVWITRMLERRGRTHTTVLSESQRTFDEQSVVDAFIENPWVGRACLDGAGVDTSRDF